MNVADRDPKIFMYGGFYEPLPSTTVEHGAVYVLSLPSFNWQKQDGMPDYGRYQHSCNVVGNRQMVVVGGQVVLRDELSESDTLSQSPDPWPKGIGIFDLSRMAWQSSYDASAEPYVTPDMVKAYTSKHRFPAQWSSPTVEKWFLKSGKLHCPSLGVVNPMI